MNNQQPIRDLQAPLNELHKLFDKANEVLYNNELPKAVITIQSKGNKKHSLGWCTVHPVWIAGDMTEMHEINLTSEALNREFNEIAKTLLHEMVHLYCRIKDIKDTSRNHTYHNKNFKLQAELHGLQYKYDKPDEKIGYSALKLTQETIEMIDTWGINKEVFQLARKDFSGAGKEKKKTNVIKWVCPKCGDIVRSSKPTVKLICWNDDDGLREPCMTRFIMEG